MAVVDASIPLAARSQPIDMGRVLSLADMAMQMRQNQQNMRAQNALRTILAQPGSVDPKTGAPTPNALAQIMRVSPVAGMQLQRNALALQREQTQAEVAKTDLFAKKLSMSHDVGNEALSVYEQALSKGVPDQQARSLAQTTYTDGIKRMSSSGLFSQQDLSQINPTFDPARARANAMTYKDWMARKDAETKEAETVRHDKAQESIAQKREDREALQDQGRKWSQPSEVMADDGKGGQKMVLGQQNKITGEWVTADENHTPIKVSKKLSTSEQSVISDDAAKLVAEGVLAGNHQAMTGMARSQANITKVNDWIAKLAKDRGMSGADIAAKQAEFSGMLASERALGTRTANMEIAANEVKQMAPLALSLSGKVDRTKFPTLNSVILAADRHTGGENVVQFGLATNSLIYMYAKFLNPNGIPTDADKARATDILSTAWSKGQFNAAVKQIEKEIEVGQTGLKTTKQEVNSQISGKSSPVKSAAPKIGSIEDGYRFKGGNPADAASWEKVP